MAVVYLIDRLTGRRDRLQEGTRLLDGIDGFALAAAYDPAEAVEVTMNGAVIGSGVTPFHVDPNGECVVRVVASRGQHRTATYRLAVPPLTVIDDSTTAALTSFAERASAIPDLPGIEDLTSLPFFAQDIAVRAPNADESRKVDDAILTALPSLRKICAQPRRALTVERRAMPIDQVRRIPPDAIERLASRPEFWQSRTAVTIRPSRLMTEVPEETLDLYENRVAVTLVRRLLTYLRDRLRAVDRAFFQAGSLDARLFQDHQYKYNAGRDRRLRQLWSSQGAMDYQGSSDYEISKDLRDKLHSIAARVSACLDSPLLVALSRCPSVASPLKATNILSMDPDYRRIQRLWEVLDEYERIAPRLASRHVAHRDTARDYATYVRSAVFLALHWLGFVPQEGGTLNVQRAGSYMPSLRCRNWTANVPPIDDTTLRIDVELRWAPNEAAGNGSEQADHEQSWRKRKLGARSSTSASRERPCNVKLSLIPMSSFLYGTQRELEPKLNRLYQDVRSDVLRATEGSLPTERGSQLRRTVVFVHPTDIRDRYGLGESLQEALVRKLVTIGTSFWSPKDYDEHVRHASTGKLGDRVGMLPVSPLDLGSIERLQHLILFHTLGTELVYGFEPAACPVCSGAAIESEDGSGSCSSCKAHWSSETCRSCGRRIPKLEPRYGKFSTDPTRDRSYAEHITLRDELLGRDQLAPMCESDELPSSGRIRVLCPECGFCTGNSETQKSCTRRCARAWLEMANGKS